MKKPKRPYRMGARAAAAEETGRRLVEAMQELFAERRYEDIALEAVAERAGVTLQTLLRRFGSKSGLLRAAAEDALDRVEAQRRAAIPDDLEDCVENLFNHYEQWAGVSLKLLEQEERLEEIAPLTKQGRATHAAWVAHAFAGALARRRGRERELLRSQLIAVCDVYVWKLLRKDLGRSRAEAEAAVRGILAKLVG